VKEAAGEANMTVITIVLIGVIAAVGLVLVPRLMKNVRAKSCCTNGGWYVSGKTCCNPNNPGCSQDKVNGKWAKISFKNMWTTNMGEFQSCMQD